MSSSATAPNGNQRRILFVDDERSILDGLQNALRKRRRQWDMVFVSGGAEALEELKRGPFDLVISDMRMPGMDGATLLSKVKEDYPSSGRVILTGQADSDSIARALPVAHQFLNKPCESSIICSVIERICRLNDLIKNDTIKQIVGKMDKLPSVPNSYLELTNAASNPDTSLQDLAQIVQQDPAMTVKVLQLVNSAYFGLAQRISSIQSAVSYLGVEVLKALVLTIHVFGTVTAPPESEGLSLADLQGHALLTARIAKRLAGSGKFNEEAFTAALLHDIGKVILLVNMPQKLNDIRISARTSHKPFHVVEEELLGVSHGTIGAYLVGLWGLPISIVEAVAYHHRPSDTLGDGNVTPGFSTLATLHIADALVDWMLSGQASVESSLDIPYLQRSGIPMDIPQWTTIANEERSKSPWCQ